MVIIQFIKENIICDILLIFALLSWGVTIGAIISSKKTGHYVSGLPAVGGILVIIGFLTSSVKWLAVLGLLDPCLVYLIFVVIPGSIIAESKIKKWEPSEEYDGFPVADFTRYHKSYEEIHTPFEDSDGYLVNYINRYIIISKNGRYELLKVQYTDRIIERYEFDTIEECREKASPKAKWQKMTGEKEA